MCNQLCYGYNLAFIDAWENYGQTGVQEHVRIACRGGGADLFK